MTFITGAWAFLKRVPWQAWVAIALAVAFLLYGEHKHSAGYDKGRAEVMAELRKAEQRAADNALKAVAKADAKSIERAEKFEHEQDVLRDVIEAAEAKNENALDAMFSANPKRGY